MRLFFILSQFLAFTFLAQKMNGQSFTFRAGFGGTTAERCSATCTDNAGNLYVTGSMVSGLNFGTGALAFVALFDGYVAKFDKAGVCQWAMRFGGSGNDQGFGLVTDGTSVYVTGTFATSMTVGSSATVYSSNGGTDAFVIKLDAGTGATTWVTTYGGNSTEAVHAICMDAAGDVYVSGNFFSTSANNFGSFSRTPNGGTGSDLYVIKMSAAGTIVWAATGGALGNDNATGSGICYVPSLDEVVVAGSVVGGGLCTYGTTTFTAAGMNDIALLEIDATTGTFVSGKTVGGAANNEEALAACYDAQSGNVFIGGYFQSAALTFGSNPAISNTVTGTDELFYACYNPVTDNFTWSRSAGTGGTGTERVKAMTSNGGGGIILAGAIAPGTASFASSPSAVTLTNSKTTGAQIFLVKVDAATGNTIWAKAAVADNTTTTDQTGNAVSSTTNGDGLIWLGGLYLSNVTLSALPALASNANSVDILIALFKDVPTVLTQPRDSVACAGLPVAFSSTVAPGLTYSWQQASNAAFSSPTTLTNTGVYSGTGTPVLTISDNTSLDGKYFRITVTNAVGNATSSGALLTVTPLTLPTTEVAETHLIGTKNNYAYTSACEEIARVVPLAGTPISGNVTSTVWRETAVPVYNSQPYVQRHYQVTPAAGSTGTVTLYFSQADFTNFNAAAGSILNLPIDATDAANNKANLRISKFSGTSSNGTGLPGSYSGTGTLIDPADANIIWNATYSRWEVTFDVNGFSGFFVQTATSVLPLKMLYFNGSKVDNTNRLVWRINADNAATVKMWVERSTDGINFASIYDITTSNTANEFLFTDNNPASGINYYRLKLQGSVGSLTYSDIVALSNNKKEVMINSVQPNPATDNITLDITGTQAAVLQLNVYSFDGKLALTQPATISQGNNKVSINVSKLAAGSYSINVYTKNVMTGTAKFIKQ